MSKLALRWECPRPVPVSEFVGFLYSSDFCVRVFSLGSELFLHIAHRIAAPSLFTIFVTRELRKALLKLPLFLQCQYVDKFLRGRCRHALSGKAGRAFFACQKQTRAFGCWKYDDSFHDLRVICHVCTWNIISDFQLALSLCYLKMLKKNAIPVSCVRSAYFSSENVIL